MCIRDRNIDYDQNGFVSNEDWLLTAEKTEDILQLSHIYDEGPILDVGFYVKNFKIYVIYNYDWEKPAEIFESVQPELVSDKLYELIDKYANG